MRTFQTGAHVPASEIKFIHDDVSKCTYAHSYIGVFFSRLPSLASYSAHHAVVNSEINI